MSFFSTSASVRIVVLVSIDLHRKKLMVHESDKYIVLRRLDFLSSQLHKNEEYSFINTKIRGVINAEKGGSEGRVKKR